MTVDLGAGTAVGEGNDTIVSESHVTGGSGAQPSTTPCWAGPMMTCFYGLGGADFIDGRGGERLHHARQPRRSGTTGAVDRVIGGPGNDTCPPQPWGRPERDRPGRRIVDRCLRHLRRLGRPPRRRPRQRRRRRPGQRPRGSRQRRTSGRTGAARRGARVGRGRRRQHRGSPSRPIPAPWSTAAPARDDRLQIRLPPGIDARGAGRGRPRHPGHRPARPTVQDGAVVRDRGTTSSTSSPDWRSVSPARRVATSSPSAGAPSPPTSSAATTCSTPTSDPDGPDWLRVHMGEGNDRLRWRGRRPGHRRSRRRR